MGIDFRDKVAIVTGAGGGIGREYSLELARRGAKVLVNDLGGARDGTGQSDAAEETVEEICAAGGEAMADGGSVTDLEQMEAMVARVSEQWGGVHILINNAGILRDKSFAKMSMEDFRAVIDVHLIGSANCSKAVWELMREQNYGRLLMTASSTGLYGNFGQVNYGAAKMGLVGLAKSLHVEGAKYDIKVNSVVPVAATRMTEDLMPAEAAAGLDPAFVVPAALFLVSDDAPSNMIIGAGAGIFHAAYVTMTEPVALPEDKRTVEGVAEAFERIIDRAGETVPQSGPEHTMAVLAAVQKLQSA